MSNKFDKKCQKCSNIHMIVKFSRKMEKLMDEEYLLRKYPKLKIKIDVVVSVLLFSKNLGEVPNVPPTRRHKLLGNYKNCWGIDLDKSYRLIVVPSQLDEDLSKIKCIKIVDIVDYH